MHVLSQKLFGLVCHSSVEVPGMFPGSFPKVADESTEVLSNQAISTHEALQRRHITGTSTSTCTTQTTLASSHRVEVPGYLATTDTAATW